MSAPTDPGRVIVTIAHDRRSRPERCAACGERAATSHVTVTPHGGSRTGAPTCSTCAAAHAVAMLADTLGVDVAQIVAERMADRLAGIETAEATAAETCEPDDDGDEIGRWADDPEPATADMVRAAERWAAGLDYDRLADMAAEHVDGVMSSLRMGAMSVDDRLLHAERIAATVTGLTSEMPEDRAEATAWALRWDYVAAWAADWARTWAGSS